MGSSIIVPIDGSSNALAALEEATRLSHQLDCPLVLVNVQHRIETLHTKMFFSKTDIHQYQQELAEKALEDALQQLEGKGVSYEEIVRIGYPIHEICEVAKEMEASYIVIGSRGRGPLKGQVFGSVSMGVLQEAECPVIVVKKK